MIKKHTAHLFFGLIGASILGFALNPVHAPPIPDAVGTLWMVLTLMAAIVFGIILTWRAPNLQVPWAAFSFIGFGVAAFLSLLNNKEAFWQTYGATNLLWLFGALGLAAAMSWAGQGAAQSSNPERAVRWLGIPIVLAGLVTVCIELIQAAKPGFSADGLIAAMPADLTPYGNLVQRNHAAALLGLALLLVAYFSHERRMNKAWISAGLSAAAFLSLGIVLTASRIGLAYVVLAGGFWGLLSSGQGQATTVSRWRTARWVAFGLLAGVLAYVLLGILSPSLMAPHGISAASRFEGAGMSARDAIWHQAWAMFRAHPLFGTGWGSFSAYALAGALTSAHPQYVSNAHNIVLQILSETGLVGLVLAGVPFGMSVWCTWRKGADWFTPAWRKLAVAVCLLIGGYSLVEYPLWSPLFLVPFALFWGMASAPSPVGGKAITFGVKVSSMAFSVAMIGALIPSVTQYRAISTDTLFSTVPGGLQMMRFNAQALRASSALPLYEPEIEFLQFQSIPVSGPGIDAKITLGNRVAMHYTTPATLEKLAALCIVKGDATQAAERLAVVSRLYPKMAPGVEKMLNAAAQSGNPVAAKAMMTYRAISTKT